MGKSIRREGDTKDTLPVLQPSQTGTTNRYAGLTPNQVLERRARFGSNRFTPVPQPPWWSLYLAKFDDPIIRVLMVAAGLSILVGWVKGEHLEGITIVITIFLATFLGFLNEYKAAAEFRLLQQAREDVPAKVVRDDAVTLVPRADLVVDDILLLATGDEVPADGLVLEAVSLAVDQSRLTGESIPCEKSPIQDGPVSPGVIPESDDYSHPNKAFRGTIVADGHGVIRLSAVGDHTELGRLIQAAQVMPQEPTPLARQLEKLGGVISVLGFTGAAGIFLALIGRGWWEGSFRPTVAEWSLLFVSLGGLAAGTMPMWLSATYELLAFLGFEVTPAGLFPEGDDWQQAGKRVFWVSSVLLAFGWASGALSSVEGTGLSLRFLETLLRFGMIVVAIIVVAVPEGLSMAVTLCLAFAMRHMLNARSLVRKMDACETIGAASVICSDKTGTLTLNEMQVTEAAFSCAGDRENLSGHDEQGNWAIGNFWPLLCEALSVNSTAHLSHEDPAGFRPIGNFTEGALLGWLLRQGADYRQYRNSFAIEHQWPFTTARKWMATQGVSSRNGNRVVHVKGAPEVVLDFCATIAAPEGHRPMTSADRQAWLTRLSIMQEQGKRTLGFAFRENDPQLSSAEPGDDPGVGRKDLIWLGFVGIADPVRPDVPEAMMRCRQAGIEVKIVTGDHPRTAQAVASQISGETRGWGNPGCLTGDEFRALDDRAAMAILPRLRILARAKPLDKLRLVTLLQRSGQVVAVTGDGVNDAPALQRADVGLAMGASGTDTAKEASDIILLDDSFSSITRAVLWGRSLYVNIQRFLIFQLSINLAALGLTLLSSLFGFPLPFTVLQMLWINLIMDSFAALALATEPPDPALMARPPRSPTSFIITPAMLSSILRFGGFCIVFFFGLLAWLARSGPVPDRHLTLFFSAFVLVQFWNLMNIRRWGLKGEGRAWLPENPWFLVILAVVLLGQILLVQFGGVTFRTVPLASWDWVLLFAASSLTLLFPHPEDDAA